MARSSGNCDVGTGYREKRTGPFFVLPGGGTLEDDLDTVSNEVVMFSGSTCRSAFSQIGQIQSGSRWHLMLSVLANFSISLANYSNAGKDDGSTIRFGLAGSGSSSEGAGCTLVKSSSVSKVGSRCWHRNCRDENRSGAESQPEGLK